MKQGLVIGALVLFIGLFLLYLLKGCTDIVSSVDGERNSKMMPLSGSYYYNTTDKKIWQSEEATDSYKDISQVAIDSLMWDSSVIIGFANRHYFLIDLTRGGFSTFNDRSGINRYLNKELKSLKELPALSFD